MRSRRGLDFLSMMMMMEIMDTRPRYSVTVARAELVKLCQRAAKGEMIVLTLRNEPIAALGPVTSPEPSEEPKSRQRRRKAPRRGKETD